MRLPFQAYYDLTGNLNCMDGPVIDLRTGAVFQAGAGAIWGHDGPDPSYRSLSRVLTNKGATFLGGSGRNLSVSGGPAVLNGYYQPEIPDQFRHENFVLVKTGSSAATISDDMDVVATLSTGGTAPIGSYASTTYGADTYNSGDPFTLVLAAEEGAPGAIPSAFVQISSGTAKAGLFTAVDASNFTSATDPDWTINILSTGEARMLYQAAVVAVRAFGSPFDPGGVYVALEDAYYFNPITPEDDDLSDEPEENPWGILTITYSWTDSPDLDTGTEFLGQRVGFFQGTSPYMSWTGDETSTGAEVVTIDLAQAWEDGEIAAIADIVCRADWFPSAGGSGPAHLEVSYSLGGFLFDQTIHPGGVTPSSTAVVSFRLSADGSLVTFNAVWQATVTLVPVPPRAGTGYLEITESAGSVSAVAGPFFATAMPASADPVFRFPLFTSDGLGGIEPLHIGDLPWRGKNIVSGLSWVSLTAAEYDALDPIDPDTVYDITDAPWED